MIALIKDWIHHFLFHKDSARASIRSFLTFISIAGTIVIGSASDSVGGVNVQIIKSWDFEAWMIRLGCAFVAAAAIRIKSSPTSVTAEAIK